MRSALCEATVRCQLRRLRATVAAAPVPCFLVLGALVVAPGVLWRVGHAVGTEIAVAVEIARVRDALVLGPLLAAVAAGAALALSRPERHGLGPQIAAGPPSARAAVVAQSLAPVGALALAAGPAFLGVSLGIASALPGGVGAGVALSAAVATGVVAGAVVAESALALVRGSRRPALGVAAAATLWCALGRALGSTTLGPLALASRALAGSVPAWMAAAAAVGAGALLSIAWIELAARRPAVRARGGRAGAPMVRGRRCVDAWALGLLLARRSDVRAAAGGAVVLGCVGIALGAASAAPGQGAFFLAVTTTALGALFAPLAACGAVMDGAWLWARSPRGRGRTARGAAATGIVGAALPTATAGAAALTICRPPLTAAAAAAVLATAGAGCALTAGALVPWRRAGAGDQAATVAALAGVALGVSAAVGVIAPRAVAAGAPSAVVAGGICVSALLIAGAAVAGRLGRGRA